MLNEDVVYDKTVTEAIPFTYSICSSISSICLPCFIKSQRQSITIVRRHYSYRIYRLYICKFPNF